MKKRSLFFIAILWGIPLFSQIEIPLANPSFEGYPRAGTTPEEWYNCGSIDFPNESPPDIHPHRIPKNGFGVSTPAYEGDTYLGLVVRDNDTWESVSQRMGVSLSPESAYRFTVYLARSATYISAIGDRSSNAADLAPETIINHNTPIVFRLWAGTDYCDKAYSLGVSNEIEHEDWQEYNVEFIPERSVTHLTLEAFYKVPSMFPYNGNILVDNCSLFQIDSVSMNTSVNDLNYTIESLTTKGKPAPLKKESTASITPSITWDELMLQADSNWLEINALIENKTNDLYLFPKPRVLEQNDFYKGLIQDNEFLGAVLRETGGMLADEGWIRIFGANRLEMGRSLAGWNKGKSYDDDIGKPTFVLIADDVVGGHFIINYGLFTEDIGKIFYLDPEYLEWKALGFGYPEFIHWVMYADLNDFYQGLRWKGWKEDVSSITTSESFLFKPLLWTKYKHIEKRDRQIIKAQKMWEIQAQY